MTEVKVRLSMSVPGAQMLSEQECSKNPKKSYNVDNMTLKVKTKKGKYQKETFTIRTRKQCLVKQCLNITKEAYDYMVDAKQPPTDKLAKKLFINKAIGKDDRGKTKRLKFETTVWAYMYTPIKRLDWHMSQIAESLGAVDYNFEVLDD